MPPRGQRPEEARHRSGSGGARTAGDCPARQLEQNTKLTAHRRKPQESHSGHRVGSGLNTLNGKIWNVQAHRGAIRRRFGGCGTQGRMGLGIRTGSGRTSRGRSEGLDIGFGMRDGPGRGPLGGCPGRCLLGPEAHRDRPCRARERAGRRGGPFDFPGRDRRPVAIALSVSARRPPQFRRDAGRGLAPVQPAQPHPARGLGALAGQSPPGAGGTVPAHRQEESPSAVERGRRAHGQQGDCGA